jgi:hypothetical protein
MLFFLPPFCVFFFFVRVQEASPFSKRVCTDHLGWANKALPLQIEKGAQRSILPLLLLRACADQEEMRRFSRLEVALALLLALSCMVTLRPHSSAPPPTPSLSCSPISSFKMASEQSKHPLPAHNAAVTHR